MPKRTWTEDQLKQAVKNSTTYTEVVKKLGLKYNSQTHRRIRNTIKKRGLDMSHFDPIVTSQKKNRMWTVEQVKEIVPNAHSVGDVIRKLGMQLQSTAYRSVRKVIERHNLDISHFQKQRQGVKKVKRKLEEYLKLNGPLRLISGGVLVQIQGGRPMLVQVQPGPLN